ncbi:MAG: Dabb family protein [Alphaproteobacteria bacterium]|nr:Dabb family protein [Alphaproteobacteria bacterium]
MDGYFRRFRQTVSGVATALYGRNLSPFAKTFTHLRLTAFEDKAAHEAYQVAPLHDEIAAYVLPRPINAVGDVDSPMLRDALPLYYHVILMRLKDQAPTGFLAEVNRLTNRLRNECPAPICSRCDPMSARSPASGPTFI